MNDAPDRRPDAALTDSSATDAAPPPADAPQTERQTLLVSVATDTDEDARFKEIGAHVGDGWRVVQAIPLSGDEAGPGGESEDFMRYQVTVERELDASGAIVDADRGGAADLKDVGQVSAAFGGPLPRDGDAEG